MTENAKDKKMYYCEEKQAVCITDSCSKGKELLHGAEASQGTILYEGDGYAMDGIPVRIETRLTFKDRTEEIIDGELCLVFGCGQND